MEALSVFLANFIRHNLLSNIDLFQHRTCGDRINSVQHSQYHDCWCPGSLRRQDINTQDVDYVE